ncbi:MAG: GntR family transcriptional regulator [Lachnospiraceae bacterium]|nr:GntR family transcriptional regulator [Lachnospiraceae bacterium]
MVVLDLKSNKPIYEQIVEQVKYHVIKGHLKPGDSIPSVRKLALDISITPGTVAKAYQELERQNIIETIRGKGTFIAGTIEMKQDDVRLAESKKLMRSAVLECKVMGMTEEQVTGIVKELYKEMSVC